MAKVDNEVIITALNMNGIDATQFFDDDEWDDFVQSCMSSLDLDDIESGDIADDFVLELVEDQLREAGRIQ